VERFVSDVKTAKKQNGPIQNNSWPTILCGGVKKSKITPRPFGFWLSITNFYTKLSACFSHYQARNQELSFHKPGKTRIIVTKSSAHGIKPIIFLILT